jgi:hypothetical protein
MRRVINTVKQRNGGSRESSTADECISEVPTFLVGGLGVRSSDLFPVSTYVLEHHLDRLLEIGSVVRQ